MKNLDLVRVQRIVDKLGQSRNKRIKNLILPFGLSLLEKTKDIEDKKRQADKIIEYREKKKIIGESVNPASLNEQEKIDYEQSVNDLKEQYKEDLDIDNQRRASLAVYLNQEIENTLPKLDSSLSDYLSTSDIIFLNSLGLLDV